MDNTHPTFSEDLRTLSDDSTIRVIGQPLHSSPEEIIDKYNNEDIDNFLKFEARHSCGSYVIFDGERHCFITSPGFGGGYIDKDSLKISTNLGNILENKLWGCENIIDPVGTSYYIQFNASNTYDSPLRTPFKNVVKIKPGTINKADLDDETISTTTYLRNVKPDIEFSDALHKAASKLKGKEVKLLYSGGKDSTAIYLALREELGKNNIEAVSVDTSPSLEVDVEEINVIADQLDIDLTWKMSSDNWPPDDDDYFERVDSLMRNTLCSPLSFIHSFESTSPNKYIISGQNMDAMLTGGMAQGEISPFSDLPKIRSARDVLNISYRPVYYTLNRFIPNLSLWSGYADSRTFRLGYLLVLPHIYRFMNHIGVNELNSDSLAQFIRYSIRKTAANFDPLLNEKNDIDPSVEGLGLGLLTHNRPSVVTVPNPPSRQEIEMELAELRSIWQEFRPRPSEEVCLMKYYHYGSNAADKFAAPSTIKKGGHLICNWGPFMPLFLQPFELSDAMFPKKAVKEYIKQKTGQRYDDLRTESKNTGQKFGINGTKRANEYNDVSFDWPIIKRFEHKLDTDSSMLLDNIKQGDCRDLVEKKIKYVSQPHSNNLSSRSEAVHVMKTGHRLINIELLLERAI